MKRSVALISVLGVCAGAVSIAGPAVAAPTVAASIIGDATLTLPLGDGFNDAATVSVAADESITVDVVASLGTATRTVATDVALSSQANGWTAAVPIGTALDVAGSWTIGVLDSTTDAVLATTEVAVGSGVPVDIDFVPVDTILYPYEDGILDSLLGQVSGRDETGTLLATTGSVDVVKGAQVRRSQLLESDDVHNVALSVAELAPGDATAVVSLTGPGGIASTERDLRFAPTQVVGPKIRSSAGSFFPAKDGYRDTVKFTATMPTTFDEKLPARGEIVVTKGGKKVASWPVKSTARKSVTWNGRNHGGIVGGDYRVELRVKAGDGRVKRDTTSVSVSEKRLVTRTSTISMSAKAAGHRWAAADSDSGCGFVGTTVVCVGYGADSDGVSLVATFRHGTPSSVRRANPLGKLSANLASTNGRVIGGKPALVLLGKSDNDGAAERMKKHKTTKTGWVEVARKAKRQNWGIVLPSYTAVEIERFRLAFRWKELAMPKGGAPGRSAPKDSSSHSVAPRLGHAVSPFVSSVRDQVGGTEFAPSLTN